MWTPCGFFCAGSLRVQDQRFRRLNNVSEPIQESTNKAIDFKIGHEFNELRSNITRYIVEQESVANSRALALHRGYQHLQADLVPEMLDRVITYCLDVGVRDADAISFKVRAAFETQLKALGQSLGLSFQTPSTGMTTRVIMEFKGWVDAYCAGIASRVHIAVERRRHMDPPPEPPKKKEPVGTIYNITGPTQINTHSPGSVQTNSGVSISEAAPRPPVKKTTVWKYINRVGIVATIVAGAVAVFELISHREITQPPSVASPATVDVASPPVPTLPILVPEPAPQAPPESPKTTPRKHRASHPMNKPNDAPNPGLTINGPTQINNNSPNSQQNNYYETPQRHLTDEERQAIRATLAQLPKDASVTIAATMGDGEAINYAREIFAFMQSIGFTNFKVNSLTGSPVAWTVLSLPSPPRLSLLKSPDDGSYQITVHQR